MGSHQSPEPSTIDDVLSILADRHCRATLSYFQSAGDVCSLQELAGELTEHGSGDTDRLALELHHSSLPRLDDAGALDYDARSRTVRYHGHGELEALLDAITAL